MKISKDYLRQLIKESLNEVNDFSPAPLPYEVGAQEAKPGFVIPPDELRQIISHLTGKGAGPSHALAVLTQLLIKNKIVKHSDLYYGP